MEFYDLYFQIHKYRNGHQLVASSIELERTDQDTIDRLSDLSGQIRPGEFFEPYLTCYPLPSEKHFVIARTWQDLNATRAGCVLTKSILIPMKKWEVLTDVAFIFNVLLDSKMDLEFPQVKHKNYSNFNPVYSGPLEELVEALFLEQRKPILIFDAKDKEDIISRLYSVFFPSLRRNFASCTFALNTRTIKNRTFDLLFTEGNLRTRFSEWQGRRIEGSNFNRKLARHRWTDDLVKQIFELQMPSLLSHEENYPFDLKKDGSESTLRLSLLWRELVQKVVFEQSPMALLGLLDIINSQNAYSKLLYERIEPQIQTTILNAYKILLPIDAWKFYGALLVKHKKYLMSRAMLSEVHSACRELTFISPNTAIKFITNFDSSIESTPAILFSSIGDGLALNLDNTRFNELSNQLGLLLLATSKSFAARSMILASNDKKIVSNIIEYLDVNNEKSLRRAKNNLLINVYDVNHNLIFCKIISDQTFEEYKKITSYAISHFALKSSFFNTTILEETTRHNAVEYLFDSLLNLGKYDELLFKILDLKPYLVRKIILDQNIGNSDKELIITNAVINMRFDSVTKLASVPDVANDILQIIQKDRKVKKEIVIEFALNDSIPLLKAMKVMESLSSLMINNIRQDRFFNLIDNAINDKSTISSAIKVISKFSQFKAGLFLNYIFDNISERSKFPEIFDILFTQGLPTKKMLVINSDLVSSYLAEYSPSDINKVSMDNWVELLGLTTSKEKKQKVAMSMLQFAYGTTIKETGVMVEEAFPIVYQSFLKGKSVAELLTFWIFPDWDKCKILRYDLVDRYLISNWPRSGLLNIGEKLDILKEVLRILNDKRGGKKFIKEAFAEIGDNPNFKEKTVSRKVKKK
ncbi:hypothetical protein [Flavobacterium ginsengiterrae]|uniref:Uncharacterized protein n=1 Tax=Flavobacterium ginsengiterrae TaxID=871695 RepID=A0ABP7GR48_9FLAO